MRLAGGKRGGFSRFRSVLDPKRRGGVKLGITKKKVEDQKGKERKRKEKER